ncbi:MAG: TetR/AcrR family transcriptional regulator [Solirubrobacteraceae bacterium]
MADAVNPKRRYDSPRRREQAQMTRRAILQAAERLFAEQGYAVTTMAQVATAADVSLKTVYLVFDTKAGVLGALWHLQLRGDQGDAPVAERSWYQEVLDEADPTIKLRLNARNARAVKERAGALLGVIRNAAVLDPDIGELWKRISSDFHDNQRAIVTSLEAQGALRPDLDVARGADILWALNHPDLWHLLVGERGWTPEAWERWFYETSCRELLAERSSGQPDAGPP